MVDKFMEIKNIIGEEGDKKFINALDNYRAYCLRQYGNQVLEKRLDEYNLIKFLNFMRLALEIFPEQFEKKKRININIEMAFQYLHSK